MGKKKKKTIKNNEPRPSFMETLGVSQFFHNERLSFFVGLLLFAVACCMWWSFFSFFSTGQADVSMIENLQTGELANQNGEFQNAGPLEPTRPISSSRNVLVSPPSSFRFSSCCYRSD
jgi:S-DNA-T family DNA segregation ATPase FtsK/SpoIIIE